jgi:hypothetical protein
MKETKQSMKVSRTFASILTGAAASAAIVSPALAADLTDAQGALAPLTQDAGAVLDSVTSEASLEMGLDTEDNMDSEQTADGNTAYDFGSAYGDAAIHHNHSAEIPSSGAPFTHVDASCVDAWGGGTGGYANGGYANGSFGSSAECDLEDVTQIDDPNGLLG